MANEVAWTSNGIDEGKEERLDGSILLVQVRLMSDMEISITRALSALKVDR